MRWDTSFVHRCSVSAFFDIAGKFEINCLEFIANFVFKRYLGFFIGMLLACYATNIETARVRPFHNQPCPVAIYTFSLLD